MDVKFWFEVVGNFKSTDLWKKIRFQGVNLFDAIGHVYVYGNTNAETLDKVLHTCASYGSIKGGGSYENLLHSST